MEKKNTRVAVPLSDEAYDAVSTIARVTGVSRGKYLADVLEGAIPSFLAVARAIRAAEAISQDEGDKARSAVLHAESEMLAALNELTGKLNLSLEESDGSAAGGPQGPDGAEPSDPPILTGGFRFHHRGGQS